MWVRLSTPNFRVISEAGPLMGFCRPRKADYSGRATGSAHCAAAVSGLRLYGTPRGRDTHLPPAQLRGGGTKHPGSQVEVEGWRKGPKSVP